MRETPARAEIRRKLEAHLSNLGYSSSRKVVPSLTLTEIVRVNPVRGRIVYAAAVLGGDLESESCHERLRFFSRRRTRHRSSIPFYIGIAESDKTALEELLLKLDIRSATRGGHVQIVAIPLSTRAPRTPRAPSTPRTPTRTPRTATRAPSA
jgi:hypothetical protein